MKNEGNVEKCWMCTSHSTITNNTERLRPNTTELKKNNLHLTYPIQIHPHEYLTNKPRCSSKLKLSNIFNQLKNLASSKIFPTASWKHSSKNQELKLRPSSQDRRMEISRPARRKWAMDAYEKDPGALSDW